MRISVPKTELDEKLEELRSSTDRLESLSWFAEICTQPQLMKLTETLSVYMAESQAIIQYSFTATVTDKVSVCVCVR